MAEWDEDEVIFQAWIGKYAGKYANVPWIDRA